jgi:inositol oxygenase
VLLLTLLNIEKQTLSFNIEARVDFKSRRRARMSVWEAIELLSTLADKFDRDASGPLSGILTI